MIRDVIDVVLTKDRTKEVTLTSREGPERMASYSVQDSLKGEVLEKFWQALICVKTQIEARIKHAAASMALGIYSTAEWEDVKEGIVTLLIRYVYDIVTQMVDLMELAGLSQQDCNNFFLWEDEW